MSEITFGIYPSSLGNIVLVAAAGRLVSLAVTQENSMVAYRDLRRLYPGGSRSDRPFRKILLQLNRYLRGQKLVFEVDVDISGLPEFTQTVLRQVRQIPFGETRSYRWIAGALGNPRASRAVGQAVKRNPVPIVIPCHRVVREDGSIGGFSMEHVSKEYLLRLEGRQR